MRLASAAAVVSWDVLLQSSLSPSFIPALPKEKEEEESCSLASVAAAAASAASTGPLALLLFFG